MDFSNYKIKLNMKTCCMYEQLADKSFFKCTTEEDALLLMYCSLVCNNDFNITFNAFKILLKFNKKVEKWIYAEYEHISDFTQQFNTTQEEGGEGDVKDMNITEMATSLIVQHKMDAHYVMYELDMWEIMPLYEMADSIKKEELEEKRLWTYLTIAPHIDTRKIKSPQGLLNFPWEKDNKVRKAQKDIEEKKDLINQILGIKDNG